MPTPPSLQGAPSTALHIEHAVERILADNDDSALAAQRALETLCEDQPWDFGACWRLEPDRAMHLLALWQRHPARSRGLAQRAAAIPSSQSHGLLGRCWRLNRPQWVENLASDFDLLSPGEAEAAGLGAALCLPVQFRGQAVGMLLFAAPAGIQPPDECLPVLLRTADRFAQFIDRQTLLASLRAGEERFRSLFDHAGVALHCATLAGDSLALNQACMRLLGYATRGEALRATARQLYADAGVHALILQQLRGTGTDPSREVQLRRQDGSLVTVRAHSALLPASQWHAELCLSTFLDLSAEGDLERRQWQARKMESISRLAGGVAHDFNNLLTIINGYSELLLDRTEPDDQSRAPLEHIQSAGERAAGLTRRLLALSRQQAAEPPLLDVATALEGLEPRLRAILGPGIRLTRFAPAGLDWIRIEPESLEQMLCELARNARDAMPQGGDWILELNPVEIDAAYLQRHVQARPGTYLRLTASDTGCGMDAETRRHAFEPFFTTKPKGVGRGLGLSNVYGLAMRVGAWVELYSEAGHGTTVKIYWPQAQARTAPPEPAPPLERAAAKPGAGACVMVAEDENEIRGLLREVLQAAGYHVAVTARDGEEALAMAPEQRLDLLITDVIMPGLLGPRLAERLWERHPRLKVLFISGFTEQAVLHQGLLPQRRAGVAYLQKPFGPEALLAMVRSLVEAPAAPREAGT